MKDILLLLIAFTLFSCSQANNQESTEVNDISNDNHSANIIETNQVKVLTLGSFHFKFPNLDVDQTSKEDQIDVLEPKYQEEIELIVDKLEKFKPTIIVIERQPKKQQKYDSLYTAYVNGTHKLSRSEEQQIGFRLSKRLGLKQLYCVDAWGTDYEDVRKAVYENDTVSKKRFMDYFYNNPDTILNSWLNEKKVFKTEGILAELKRINTDEHVKKGLGDYLIGIFKYETEENDQFGPDFVTSWWFNRNLRIFRNIQRINAKSDDRILVIYGSGHMNLLNIFFDSSPEYQLMKINDYL
ncbi:DUF5694 domain-containing protein [Aquimarina algiphila]|uniref:DUF5694 domain-containing protein n=1 Tax=Aquimarina algiphila TaxID=2047982 RepID=UPI00232E0851|nr:DUF5694 domain-containing protein [Aquimarina algiphila]